MAYFPESMQPLCCACLVFVCYVSLCVCVCSLQVFIPTPFLVPYLITFPLSHLVQNGVRVAKIEKKYGPSEYRAGILLQPPEFLPHFQLQGGGMADGGFIKD